MEHNDQKPRRIRWGRILGGLFLLLILAAAGAYGIIFHVNAFRLELTLNGEASRMLDYTERYEEPGARVLLYGTLFWQEGIVPEGVEVSIQGEIDPAVLGRQEIRYRAELFDLEAEAVRTVHVIDSVAPEITLEPMAEEYVPGQPFVEPGFAARDAHDGVLTDRVVRREEPGQIVYAVTDRSGNPAVARRSVPGFDPQPPVVTLEGGEALSWQVGVPYREPGYAASDNLDGDLTELVSVEGAVDVLVPGDYPITYTVSDSGGNETVQTRMVTVEAVPWPDTEYPREKTIYLTFDDGPGPYTLTLLDILDRYGAKATFFVVDSGYGSVMREIVRRGHSIGIHSVTHKYEEIYSSPEAFFRDLYGMQQIIYDNTGVKTTLMRFPGGSSNAISRRYCEGIMTTLTQAVRDAGFQYFDWNVDSGDAGGTTKKDGVRDNVIDGVRGRRAAIVLQHDIHGYSVSAVEEILQWGKRNGYRFSGLKETSPGYHQDLLN